MRPAGRETSDGGAENNDMLRKHRRSTLRARWGRRLRCLRLSWKATSKSPWIFLFLFIGVAGSFGWLLQTVHAAKLDRQSVRCLALNIDYEARGEPEAGQYAVAEVTMNRVAAAQYPSSVCGVVYEQRWDAKRKRMVGAFSWTELKNLPEPKGRQWERARQIAEEVYYRRHESLQLADATHYHARSIRPRWSRELEPVARIGNHIFYR